MRRYIVTLLIAIFLIFFGAIYSAYEFFQYDIVDSFENNSLTSKTSTYDVKIDGNNNIIDTSYTNDNSIVYDSTIAAGNIKIEVTYYDELVSISNYAVKTSDENIIYVDIDYDEDFNIVKKMFNITLEGLKSKNVYNYAKAIKPTLKAYINEADKDLVKIRD